MSLLKQLSNPTVKEDEDPMPDLAGRSDLCSISNREFFA